MGETSAFRAKRRFAFLPDSFYDLAMSQSKPIPVTDEQLRLLFREALSSDGNLRLMKGFKHEFSANVGFKKLFFSAVCKCGTAALLSVEIAEEKTLGQVKDALPSLLERLRGQASLFYNMSCEAHAMRRRFGVQSKEGGQ